jgi:type VI secretion system secreted protein Hcp
MAFDAFLKIDGVPGESSDEKHKGEIEVLSFHWGITQAGADRPGGGGGGAGKAQLQSFTFVHRVDKASPALFTQCCTGKHILFAELTCRKAGETPQEFLKVRFSDIVVGGVLENGNSAEILLEEVSLKYGGVEIEYSPTDRAGKLEKPVKGGC